MRRKTNHNIQGMGLIEALIAMTIGALAMLLFTKVLRTASYPIEVTANALELENIVAEAAALLRSQTACNLAFTGLVFDSTLSTLNAQSIPNISLSGFGPPTRIIASNGLKTSQGLVVTRVLLHDFVQLFSDRYLASVRIEARAINKTTFQRDIAVELKTVTTTAPQKRITGCGHESDASPDLSVVAISGNSTTTVSRDTYPICTLRGQQLCANVTAECRMDPIGSDWQFRSQQFTFGPWFSPCQSCNWICFRK